MKYIYVILACLSFSLFSCKNKGNHAENGTKDSVAEAVDTMKLDSIAPGIKRFEMEKGIMEMIMYTTNQTLQKRTIYFDRYGARLVIIDARGSYIYQMNGFEYHINPDKKVVKNILRNEDQYDPTMLNALLMNDDLKKAINWTEDGEEEILGKKCKKYKCHELKLMFTNDVWLYKGFPMRVKIEDPVKNASIIECKKMQEGVDIDPAKFALPKFDK